MSDRLVPLRVTTSDQRIGVVDSWKCVRQWNSARVERKRCSCTGTHSLPFKQWRTSGHVVLSQLVAHWCFRLDGPLRRLAVASAVGRRATLWSRNIADSRVMVEHVSGKSARLTETLLTKAALKRLLGVVYVPVKSQHTACFLSASLDVSKRGAYWDRLCRDVVGRWLVGRLLVVTRVHCGQTVHPRPIVTMEH